jgi:hypothetical protein
MLDRELVFSILRDLHKTEKVKLIDWEERSVSVAGENWCNNIVAVDVNGSRQLKG